MQKFVTHSELDEAIAAVKSDIADTEQRLRREWTDTVRYEVGRVSNHLSAQDVKINWTLGLIITLLLTLIGALVWLAVGSPH